MKKFTKGMLVAAGIFGTVGIGLTAAGGVMGASMSELTEIESLQRALRIVDRDDYDDYDDSDDYYDSDDDSDDYYDTDDDDDYDDSDDSEHYTRTAVKHDAASHDMNEHSKGNVQKNAGTVVEKSTSSADGSVYQLQYQPVKIDISLKHDELVLEEGDSYCVRVYNDSGNNVTVKESADTLKIRSTKKTVKDRKVCISYPKDVKFQELDIEMGAGTVYINSDIYAEKLSVEMGAGEVESEASVTTRKAELEIGTGSMTFTDLSAEKTDGECGLGELDLTMTGEQEDYNYDLECGIGNLDIGSDSYSGLGREKNISNAAAARKLDLECGMGNVSVSFSGKEHRN